MQGADESDESNQKSQSPAGGMVEPSIKVVAVPTAANTRANIQQPNDTQKAAEPISVRLIEGERLKPFEEQSLAIAREMLAVSRRTYWITVFGFLAALAAAIFVGSQFQVMSYQTQIMASQTESAAAGASLDQMNTRKQLSIADEQAKSAQQGVEAICKTNEG